MNAWRLKLALLAALLGIYGLLGCFPGIMRSFGVGISIVPFRDTHSMLAASDSARAGFDPYVENPYDVAREKHIYPDWWFVLGRIGLTRADTPWLGALIVGLFCFTAAFVTPLRLRSDFWWTLLVCASPPFWLAVNRANPDLLVFAVLTPVVPMLLHPAKWVRLLAVVPVAFATGLKLFPLLAGLVLLYPAPSRSENVQRWALIAGLAVLLAWSLADDVRHYLEAGWVARGLFAFGAASVPLHFGGSVDASLALGRVAGLLLLIWAVAKPVRLDAGAASESMARYTLMGGAVLAGIFFLSTGYLYKIIFVLWLLPALLQASRGNGAGRGLGRVALFSLIGLVWLEGLACWLLTTWPELAGQAEQIAIRRAAAITAGMLAWGLIVPVVLMFGVELRRCWAQRKTSAVAA